MNYLRLILSTVVMAFATASWAQAPQSGTYTIKGANGKYVEIKGKYYAKPDAAETTDYTTIGLGVGYASNGGYRVYSLTGTNPTDGSTIEVYDYINKAYTIATKFATEKMNSKLSSMLEGVEIDGYSKEEIITMMDAFADSICKIYTDDYAYMTLVPEGHYGNKWVVRAKATVPAIPYTVDKVGSYYVKGHVVIPGHECTDLWDWAKQHVLKYLSTSSTNTQLVALIQTYLDEVQPGTTYYLTCQDNETFHYATEANDAGLWTLEEVNTTADGLTPGAYYIKNDSSDYYVAVTGKYAAAPNVSESALAKSSQTQKQANFSIDFGRSSKADADLYRLTELSAADADAVAYIEKGMNKAFELVDTKLTSGDYYTKLASMANSMMSEATDAEKLTADDLRADVRTALELCAQHYAYLNLKDNGETVSLFVDMPEVPALLDVVCKSAKEKDFETIVKEQLDKYFESTSTNTDSHLRNLWKQNRDTWGFGHRYYLAADKYNTFAFTTDGTQASTKWQLTDFDAEDSNVANPYKGYYRIKNVGGYQQSEDADVQQYVTVSGRTTADISTTDAEKNQKAGTVLYLNLDANGTKIAAPYDATKTTTAYEILNLRSQGIDVLGGAESSVEELAKMFGDISFDLGGSNSNLTPVYNGYLGFARFMLCTIPTMGVPSIAGHATDEWDAKGHKSTSADVETCKSALNEFISDYLPELKMKVYMIPVDGKTDTYYLRSEVPSLKPITDFYKTHKEVMDSIVIYSMDHFLRFGSHYQMLDQIGFTHEYFTLEDERTVRHWNGDTYGLWDYAEKDANGNLKKYSAYTGTKWNNDPFIAYKEDANGEYYRLAYSTILNDEWVMFNWLKLQAWHALEKMGYDANSSLGGYLSMIHYGVPYFLIQGDNHDAKGNRVYTGNTGLGFANDGSVHGTYNDLTNAGDHAYWQLEKVDETNYFAVKPNQNKARNDKYYGATYLDFPFQAAGDNVTAVYVLSEDGIQDSTAADGTVIKHVTFDKVEGVVPAGTPAIIETTSPDVNESLAILPVVSDERSEKNELIQGTYFGGYHYVAEYESEGDGIMNTIKRMIYPLIKGSIQKKYGVDTDGKDLYFWGYNHNDSRNPYGFYLYSNANGTDRNIIPGNKPFLIIDPNDTNTRYVVNFGDGTTTSIDNVFGTTTGSSVRYDVTGRRVNGNYKGIVIENGKKVILK